MAGHGVSRRKIRNGYYLKKPYLDRINRIIRISFDHFPEENGQSLSPPARRFILNQDYRLKR
jgi:hypothetical protein